MKRFYMALAIFTVLCALSGYSLWRVYETRQELLSMTDSISQQMVQEGDEQSLKDACWQLMQYWQQEEQSMVRYVRHGELDSITNSIARLPALTDPTSRPEMEAELLVIRTIIDHIWDSELPLLRNIV